MCLVEPLNLIRDDGAVEYDLKEIKKCTDGKEGSSTPVQITPPSAQIDIVVRLSTGKDFKLTILSTSTIEEIKRQMQTQHELGSCKLLVIHFGKVLEDAVLVSETKIKGGAIVQVMVL